MRQDRMTAVSWMLYGAAIMLLCMATGLAIYRWVTQPQQPEQAAFLQEMLTTEQPSAVPTQRMQLVDGKPANLFALPEGEAEQPVGVEVEPDEQPLVNEIRIEVIRRTPHPTGKRRVLIYHTHTWEAYEPTEANRYEATETWRTKDDDHNIVCVGEELAKNLRALGLEVVHDTTDHEPPVLATAYTRSLKTLEQYRARGETFDYYIDLHRDAFNDSMKNTNTVTVDGVELARISVLIGKGTGTSGSAFEQKPNWQVNIVLAQRITDSLNRMAENLARPVIVKSGRFNQHVSENAVLIEVGNNRNTLEQALAAMPYLARAIGGLAQ